MVFPSSSFVCLPNTCDFIPDGVTVSGAGVSYYSSQALLASELAKIRIKAIAGLQPQAETGGALLADPRKPALTPLAQEPQRSEETRVTTRVPMQSQRGRGYAKGKGLEGEVEEEGEMRDTYSWPGVPRREL